VVGGEEGWGDSFGIVADCGSTLSLAAEAGRSTTLSFGGVDFSGAGSILLSLGEVVFPAIGSSPLGDVAFTDGCCSIFTSFADVDFVRAGSSILFSLGEVDFGGTGSGVFSLGDVCGSTAFAGLTS
jgi:hypothetical protein